MSAIHWRRLLSWQLDWMLCIITIQAIAYIFSIKSLPGTTIPNLGMHFDYILVLEITSSILSLSHIEIVIVIPIAIFLLYRAMMESSKFQSTIGQMLFGIKIVNSDQTRISFLRSLLRNILIFISSLILFFDCLKSIRQGSISTWHDKVTQTSAISMPVVHKHGLLLTYVCGFSYVVFIAEKTKRYMVWLASHVDSMTPQQIQEQNNMVQLANAVTQSAYYISLTIVIMGILLLCKSFLSSRGNSGQSWILRREAYLAISAFFIPAILIMLMGGFSLYILYWQNQILVSSLMP